MRVIAGELKGRPLVAPRGWKVRPTSDRVREAVFSALGDVGGGRVLDLYCGTGALAIEALSRGAREAVFVDSARRAVEAVEANLAGLGIEAAVHRRDALAYIGGVGEDLRFDLVFVDPPYDAAVRLAPELSQGLPPILSADALIVSESDKRFPLELTLPLRLERIYGDTRIALHSGG